MGNINITDKSGNTLYTIQTDNAGKVLDVKPPPGADTAATAEAAQMNALLKGVDLGATVGEWKLDKLFESLGQTVSDDGEVDVDKTLERLKALGGAVDSLKSKIEAEKAISPPNATKLAQLKNALNVAEAQLGSLFSQVEGETLTPSQKSQMASLEANHPELADKPSTPTGGGKAQVASSNQQANNAPQQTYPGAGKAQTGPGAPGGFDLNKILQSSMFQTMGIDSADKLGKSQMDQKKMMMLFMYFASMAMSGDIGAMTAFMQFITTIITKDKAMQNVNMANKLIELEDASRKATDELLAQPSYDPNNQQVGADFTKTMEKVKADQGSIATSQKLIAQMMEEFAQVSEFLNNLQKSLLDVRGRLLSRMSSFNA